MKKQLSLVLSFLILFSCLSFHLPASAVTVDEELIFGVYPFADDSTVIKWWMNDADNRYYLFLPADADKAALRVSINRDSILVNEAIIKNDDVTDVFSEGDEFTVNCEEKDYSLVVMQSENIPSVYITTKSGSLDYVHADKSNKEKAAITVVEDGEVTMSKTALKQIKGRGNSTWQYEKKPYNITFEEKTDFFGMGKAKKWSLLASYNDGSLIRNPLACYLAEETGLDYTSQYKHVDLYINGEYLGNYIVIESIEIGSTRVDINDLKDANEEANPDVEDIEELPQNTNVDLPLNQSQFVPGSMKWVEIPNDPEDISGGYLLELDFQARYAEEVSGFVSNHGQCVVVKEPEYASKAQVEYVSRLWNEAEEALYSEDGYNSLGKHYSDYFDMDSLVRMYILEEFSNENDAGRSSNYFYKSQDNDKFVASPIWDFDGAFAREIPVADINTSMPDIWFAANRYMTGWLNGKLVTFPTIFNLAFRHTDFRSKTAEVWNEYDNIFSEENLVQIINEKADMLRASGIMNVIRWLNVGYAQINAAEFYYNRWIKNITDFVIARKVNLDKGFSDKTALLYYDLNGGGGFSANYPILTKGQSAKVSETVRGTDIDIKAPSAEYVFTGWNTEADGTGTVYEPGSEIVLETEKTVLYAQWKNIADCVYGDIDGDMKITAADARLALRASVGLEYFADEPVTASYMLSDVNSDEKITSADARLILRKSVGIIDAEFIRK